MMSGGREMIEGTGVVVPLFPLPNVVFFPKTYLPLHVFEDRYREMVRDAIDRRGQIAVPLLKPGWESDYHGLPPVHDVVTVGKIQRYEPLENGRYDILLLGQYRGRVVCEEGDVGTDGGKLYREARVVSDPETGPISDELEADEAAHLLALYERFLQSKGAGETRERMRTETLSFETLVNAVPALVRIPIPEQQRLLELDDLVARGRASRELLERALTGELR